MVFFTNEMIETKLLIRLKFCSFELNRKIQSQVHSLCILYTREETQKVFEYAL